MYEFQGFHIPERMEESIQDYIQHGIIPGGFLEAVICNNLKEAVGMADEENLRNLPAYVGFFYNQAPSPCWGSEKKMEDWIRMHEEKREREEE